MSPNSHSSGNLPDIELHALRRRGIAMDDLIRKLTKDLGVDKAQARGGVIALLRAGQKKRRKADFQQLCAAIPGADKLLASPPPPSAMSSLAGGLGSLLGGRAGGA